MSCIPQKQRSSFHMPGRTLDRHHRARRIGDSSSPPVAASAEARPESVTQKTESHLHAAQAGKTVCPSNGRNRMQANVPSILGKAISI